MTKMTKITKMTKMTKTDQKQPIIPKNNKKMTQNNSRRPKKTQKSKVLPRPTDGPTDGPTDRPTERVVESRARD